MTSEQCFLGLILKDKELFEKVYNAGNIFNGENRTIFIACMKLYSQGVEITPSGIESVCGIKRERIAEIIMCADNKDIFDIKFDYLRKELASKEILNVLNERHEIKDYNDFIYRIEFFLNSEQKEKNDFVTLSQLHSEYLLFDPNKDSKINTGFSYLDSHGGIKKKNLTIIGARPKTGKSSLMVHLLRHATDNHYRSACFSMEMPRLELEAKLLANYLSYSSLKIYDKIYDKNTEMEISKKMENIKRDDVFIEERRCDLNQIIRKIRLLKKENNIDIVFIDHLHFIKDFSNKNSIEKLANMVNAFAELKNELNITIYLLAQLNRESENNPRPPRKSDLKGCGDIEQAADSIWLLHERELIDDLTSYMDIIIFNRYGVSGVLNTIFYKNFSRYSQIKKDDIWEKK